MNTDELKAALSRQIEQASGGSNDIISNERADLNDRYLGEPYGDEVENRSSVVSTDVSDVIESIMPELIEMLCASEKVVSFEPEGPEDEEGAEQETDTVNYVFYRQNDGFMVLYNFIKDGLISKNAYIKRYWSERDKVTTEEYSGLSYFEWLAMMENWERKDWDIEIEEWSVNHPSLDDLPEDAPEIPEELLLQDPASTIDVSVRLSRTEGRELVESVPPEEVLVAPRWNKVNLDECPFVAHRRVLTASDLVEMGYDKKQIKSIPTHSEASDEKEDRFDDLMMSDPEAVDEAAREILVHECFVRIDFDGDGRAELRRIMVAGKASQILRFQDGTEDNEEVETQPFSVWTPIPIPHRHYGRSVAEIVTDLQRVKTVLWRQLLDNIYLNNNPTREIADAGVIEGVTIGDLLNERPGKVLRTQEAGHYHEHYPANLTGNLLPAIEYTDSVRESRTGVTRYNQGMDAESLNHTATGIERIMSSSMRKIAMYARICAETGLRHLFRGIHGDLRRNASKEMTIRLRGEYIPVDPRTWADRADMTVDVGIGSADKKMRMAFLQNIIAEIKQHLMSGSPLTSPAHLYNAYEAYIANSGFKNAEQFFMNPMKNPQGAQGQGQGQPQQQGDPQVEAFASIEMAKVQQREQSDQRDDQIELYKARLEDDRARDQMNLDLALKVMELQAKYQTQLSVEEIKAMAKVVSEANRPPQAQPQPQPQPQPMQQPQAGPPPGWEPARPPEGF